MSKKNLMKEYAIQQITGFAQALDSPDASYLAMSMGLDESEWEEIKKSETWVPKKVIEEIDAYFREDS